MSAIKVPPTSPFVSKSIESRVKIRNLKNPSLNLHLNKLSRKKFRLLECIAYSSITGEKPPSCFY